MIGAVLFDFDGTLLNSKPLVTSILAEFAATHFGAHHEPEELAKYVGPPMTWTMSELGASDVPAAVEAYRRQYDARMFESELFDGIPTMLATVSARVPIGVATSKRNDATTAILDHLGMTDLFTTIRGEDSNLTSKAAVIRAVVADLGEVDGEIVMVGDRIYDIEGARESGIDTVAVTWGTGNLDEYAQAAASVDTVGELTDYLLARLSA